MYVIVGMVYFQISWKQKQQQKLFLGKVHHHLNYDVEGNSSKTSLLGVSC